MANPERDEREAALLQMPSPMPDEYDAGYAARYRDEAMSVAATPKLAGWMDGCQPRAGRL